MQDSKCRIQNTTSYHAIHSGLFAFRILHFEFQEHKMAEIVLGIGSSHGPLLSTPPEQWDLRAKADRENKNHWFRGKTYDYESLLKSRAPGFAHEITVEKRRERFMKCRAALESLGQEVQRGRARRGRDPRQRPARVLQRGSDAGDHDLPRQQDQQRPAPQRGRARAQHRRAGQLSGRRRHLSRARRHSPITSCGRWATRTSTWRSRTRRRAARRAAASRTPTGSSTTRFCRTRRRRACRSS